MKEIVQIFEGQEVKVKTDKGITMINLSHSARVCGLITIAKSGNEVVRWKSRGVADKLNSIRCTDVQQQYIEEIDYILDEIENADDRNSIFMSSWLTKRMAMECNSTKAMEYKNFLATLDEKKDELFNNNGLDMQQVMILAQSMQTIGNVVQSMQQSMMTYQNRIQTLVQDSIQSKDLQIEQVVEENNKTQQNLNRAIDNITLSSRNTKNLSECLKDKLSDLTGNKIMATDDIYIKNKFKLFRKYKVNRWEQIPTIKINNVYADIQALSNDEVGYYN